MSLWLCSSTGATLAHTQHWEKLQPIAFQRPLAMGCTWHWWDSSLSPANRPCLHTLKLLYRHTETGGQRGNDNDTVWPCTKSTYIWNANMLMLTFSLLLWGLVVQTCDGGHEVNDEIMHSGDVYVSVLECHLFFLSHYSSIVVVPASPHFSIRVTGKMVYNYTIQNSCQFNLMSLMGYRIQALHLGICLIWSSFAPLFVPFALLIQAAGDKIEWLVRFAKHRKPSWYIMYPEYAWNVRGLAIMPMLSTVSPFSHKWSVSMHNITIISRFQQLPHYSHEHVNNIIMTYWIVQEKSGF